MKTKFFRIFDRPNFTLPNISQNDRYVYVPIQDMADPWTDEKLYNKYGLTTEEIEFIEAMIRPME